MNELIKEILLAIISFLGGTAIGYIISQKKINKIKIKGNNNMVVGNNNNE